MLSFVKIIFGKVIRFPVCLVGFIIFTVTVILELILVHSRLLFRAHDLEVITQPASGHKSDHQEDNHAGIAAGFLRLGFRLRGFLRRRFFRYFPQAAVQVIFADRAIGIHRARLTFFRTVTGDNLNGAFAAIILLSQGQQIFLRNAIQEVDVFRIPLPVNDKVKHISVRGGDGIKLLIIFLLGG